MKSDEEESRNIILSHITSNEDMIQTATNPAKEQASLEMNLIKLNKILAQNKYIRHKR